MPSAVPADRMMASLLPYFGPAFLVAVGFMDPGNWVTLIEGGSRFGSELAWVVFFSTLLAMLLQIVSARLGVITGKHFAQICREEFASPVCALLWFLCEISIITLDLTMVLGTAIGLNVVLQMPILPILLVMAVDFLLFIVILPLLVLKRAVVITVVVVGIILLCFLLDNAFTSALPVSLVVGFLPKLRHETLYSTISIVGANVMPHNFYLHSALVKDQTRGNQSLSTLAHYYFLDTLFAFSAVLVVNLAVLSVAVAGFHNAGLSVLTLQDVQALIEQILNNSACPPIFGLAVLCAGQLSTLNGSFAGQVVSETFFGYKIDPWQHRILIRGIALVPVATCLWRYGDEGPYQMLIFSRVVLALHLPFTVAPLIKITSSERIMGHHKISFSLETLAWLFVGMLSAVNVTLVFDLVFGETEDGISFGGYEYLAGFELLTEIGGENLQSAFFAVISMGTTLSLGFLVWLIFTPLQLDAPLPERSLLVEDYGRQEEEAKMTQEALGTRPAIYKPFNTSLLSDIAVESKESDKILVEDAPLIAIPHNVSKVLQLEAMEEADALAPLKVQDVPQLLHLESYKDLSSRNQVSHLNSSAVGATLPPESASSFLSLRKPLTIEGASTVEDAETVALTKAEAEADADMALLGKDDGETDAWGSLEQDAVLADSLIVKVEGSTCSWQCEGPESEKGDTSVGSEGGSGSGSLSRLSGLGRSARRQFALILDEFWANLFDLHGQPLPPPRSHGCLAGLQVCPSNVNLHTLSTPHEESDGHKSHSKQQKSSWKKSSNMSDQARDMDAYVLRMHMHAAASTSSQLLQTQSHEDEVSPSYKSERRYSSMHMPVYHEDYDYQPATIHGYRSPSFTGRTGSTISSHRTRPLHLDLPLFGTRSPPGHGLQVDSDTSCLVEDYCNTSDYSCQPLLSSQWVSNVVSGRSFDMKGSDRLLTQIEKHLGESETLSYDSCQWDPLVYRSRDSSLGRWNPLVYRATGELDMKNTLGNSQELKQRASISHSPIGRGGQGDHVERAPLVFDELSPSQSHREAFSIQTAASRPETQSLWSRQPFEQLFGATDADGFTSHVRRQTRSSSQSLQSSLSCSSLSGRVEIKSEVLEKLQICVGKLLRLDGASWLFRTDNGADEDLITAIATTQKTSVEGKMNEPHRLYGNNEHCMLENLGQGHVRKGDNDSITSQRRQLGVPTCGKGCVWDPSLLVSFGVWCVHRVLELALMESRPELWGKYTYVLNRLQGILEPAFSKPRLVPIYCRCFKDPVLFDTGQCRVSSSRHGALQDYSSGDFRSYSTQSYPHPWPWGRNTSCAKGKCLNAATFLDMIKEVESAIGSRKGRTGTAAGDIAFPKGKENLASVLKRYKRRLSSKPPGLTGSCSEGRRV